MPFATLNDPIGPLVKTVQAVFEDQKRFDQIRAKLKDSNTTTDQLARSRNATPGDGQLDDAAFLQFIDNWLTSHANGNSKAFLSIPVSYVADQIKEGFRNAAELVAAEAGKAIPCTCTWIQVADQTTFAVLSTLNRDKSHVTILLVTP